MKTVKIFAVMSVMLAGFMLNVQSAKAQETCRKAYYYVSAYLDQSHQYDELLKCVSPVSEINYEWDCNIASITGNTIRNKIQIDFRNFWLTYCENRMRLTIESENFYVFISADYDEVVNRRKEDISDFQYEDKWNLFLIPTYYYNYSGGNFQYYSYNWTKGHFPRTKSSSSSSSSKSSNSSSSSKSSDPCQYYFEKAVESEIAGNKELAEMLSQQGRECQERAQYNKMTPQQREQAKKQQEFEKSTAQLAKGIADIAATYDHEKENKKHEKHGFLTFGYTLDLTAPVAVSLAQYESKGFGWYGRIHTNMLYGEGDESENIYRRKVTYLAAGTNYRLVGRLWAYAGAGLSYSYISYNTNKFDYSKKWYPLVDFGLTYTFGAFYIGAGARTQNLNFMGCRHSVNEINSLSGGEMTGIEKELIEMAFLEQMKEANVTSVPYYTASGTIVSVEKKFQFPKLHLTISLGFAF
jgi:hypothetical protein